MRQWNVTSASGFEGLKLSSDVAVPDPQGRDVLVKFHGASLNFRDLMIARGRYPNPVRENVVPASDGAGVIEAIGSQVARFKVGDRVILNFHQGHLYGPITLDAIQKSTGGGIDGALRQYGVYNEEGLVHMPSNLNFLQASTLTCAGLTAWNSLYGIEGRSLKPGDWVLTQGTGGVSVFAVQFAKAGGAKVIVTTSSADKAERLKQLGADHVLNYVEDPEWGQTARQLTEGKGVQHIIEVTGGPTMRQSLNAIAIEGVISIIGFRGGLKQTDAPSFADVQMKLAIIRGIFVGSREQFEQMNRAIEANDIRPVVDEKVFKLEEAQEAYQYMWDQKHFGNLCIEINGSLSLVAKI